MIDLEGLLRRRQDELRGRPENATDRLVDWWRGLDWEELMIRALGLALLVDLVLFGLVLWSILSATR